MMSEEGEHIADIAEAHEHGYQVSAEDIPKAATAMRDPWEAAAAWAGSPATLRSWWEPDAPTPMLGAHALA